MADSTIRLRQLNQTELGNFVSGILSAYPKTNISGDIVPSGSGVYHLGSASNPYSSLFTSGIYFGNSNFYAYSSGGNAYVSIDGITISSSGSSILIQGPSGAIGPSGATGAIGPTGISVTGVTYDTNTSILSFYLSDNSAPKTFNFQGLSGATGVSVTGFFQSGSYIYPQFDHFKGTGKAIQLLAGPAGPPGSLSLNFAKSGLGVFSNGDNFPNQVIINPYYSSSAFPDVSLMRGMSYTFDCSGLNTYTLTSSDISLMSYVFSGQSVPFNAGDKINYFRSGNITGYWRMVFFPNSTATGYYTTVTNPSIFNENTNQEVYLNSLSNNLYRTKTSFTANFTAKNNYKYGFMVYTLADNPAFDVICTSPTGYAYVLGNAYFSSGVGPPGPQGPIGPIGGAGPQGNIGPQGQQGPVGVSISSYNQQNIGYNQSQIQFVYSNGVVGPWINLPSGGPAGSPGPIGNLANHFRGAYTDTTTYNTSDAVTNSGSSYISISNIPIVGVPVTDSNNWQLLAQKGDTGPSGASGYADKYSSNFYAVSGFPTGNGTFSNGITGLTVNGVNVSGTGSKFSVGNIVSFQNTGIVGYSYSPFQNIILSSNSYTGTYCYGSVNSYNSQSGILSFTVLTGGTGIVNTTISGNYFLWYNYGNVSINLGANLMSGAKGDKGDKGDIGPQGPGGVPSLMRMANYTGRYSNTSSSFILSPTGYNINGSTGIDIFNILITGNGTQQFGPQSVSIDFDWNYLLTGQSLIIKIRNSGVPDGNTQSPLFSFNGNGVINAGMIKWPNGVYSRPNDTQAYIYTILRFPDENGSLACYGTYSNPYY